MEEPKLDPLALESFALEDLARRKIETFLRKCGNADPSNLYKIILKQIERPLLELVLKRCRGKQIKAAKILGLNRNTLHKKIREYQINAKDFKK